jgi:hypothetical protein
MSAGILYGDAWGVMSSSFYYRFSRILLEESADKRADLVAKGVDTTSRYLTTMGIVGALLWSMSGPLATVDESDDAFYTMQGGTSTHTLVLPYYSEDAWGDMWKWWAAVCFVNGMVSSAGCVLTSTYMYVYLNMVYVDLRQQCRFLMTSNRGFGSLRMPELFLLLSVFWTAWGLVFAIQAVHDESAFHYAVVANSLIGLVILWVLYHHRKAALACRKDWRAQAQKLKAKFSNVLDSNAREGGAQPGPILV